MLNYDVRVRVRVLVLLYFLINVHAPAHVFPINYAAYATTKKLQNRPPWLQGLSDYANSSGKKLIKLL
jgi:hypothetical protein